MGSSHVKLGAMSIINLEINFFMTRKIYVSRQLTHPLHYQSLHSLPHYHTYSYISHQHTVSPTFMSLPTVPQYSQISHCFFFYFFLVLTQYPFIISYSSIPSFKSLMAPLHLPLSSPYKVHSTYAGAVGPALPKAPHLSLL